MKRESLLLITILILATAISAQPGKSPLDELSKLELTPKELDISSTPKIVKARAGENLAQLAKRFGVDPVATARLNGLLPSSVLGAGREIKISDPNPSKPAEPVCNLSSDKSPEIRGIKLGMKESDFKALLQPQSSNLLGIGARLYPIHFNRSESYKGLEALTPQFSEGRLVWLEVIYDSSVTWETDLEFALSLGNSFGLPANSWKGWAFGQVMECSDFSVNVTRNKVKLTDTGELRRQAERDAAEQDAKKKAFKP